MFQPRLRIELRMANATDWPIRTTANARRKLIVAKATLELERRALDSSLYRPEVRDRGEWITVVFRDREKVSDPKLRGSVGPIPTFEVQLEPDTLEVKKAYFAR
jgi:hypothetical protein